MPDIRLNRTLHLRSTMLDRALVLAALATIVPVGWRFAQVAFHQLCFPFDLCFESPNLATVKLIQQGANPYSPGVYDAMPFVLTMYTPLYHYVVALFSSGGTNPFFYGRLVSLVCAAACGVLPLVVHRRDHGRWVVAIVLGFLVISFWPLVFNAAFVKNTLLGVMLSATAVVVLSIEMRGRIWVVGGICVLALATKQSFVAAPASCLAFLFLRDPREASRLLGILIGLVAAGMIAATWAWGHGFWFSVFHAVRQPFDFRNGLAVIGHVIRQPLWVGIGFGAAFSLVHTCVGRGLPCTLRASPFAFYAAFSWSVALLTIWKLGGSSDYLIESHVAAILWLSHWLRTEVERAAPPRLLWLLAGVAGLTGLEMVASRPEDYTFVASRREATMKQRLDVLKDVSEDVGKANPKFLNLVTHVDGYLVSDQIYLNDPYLYRLLWEHGILSPQPVALALTRGEFDLVAVPAHYLGAGPWQAHERVLRESLRDQYRVLGTPRALNYALLIRRGLGTAAPIGADHGAAGR